MTYAEAKTKLRKLGAAHATGDTLAASHTDLLMVWGNFRPIVGARLYEYFRGLETDDDRFSECKRLATDSMAIFELPSVI